jgi:hypothetical protein
VPTKEAVDLAQKLAEAYMRMRANPRATPEAVIFMIVDQASPHELGIEDLCAITKFDRSVIGPVINMWTGWGYMQERGGKVSRQR